METSALIIKPPRLHLTPGVAFIGDGRLLGMGRYFLSEHVQLNAIKCLNKKDNNNNNSNEIL